MARGGWEKVVVPPAARLVDLYPTEKGGIWPAWTGPPPFAVKPDRHLHKEMSPNHHAVGAAGRLLWAAAYGSESDYAAAKVAALFWLDLELYQIGFMQGEQMTGMPHGGFHMLALFAAILAALWAKDAKLLALLLELLRRLFGYLAITATDEGEIVCCMERGPNGPAAPQQSVIWRESQGMEHPEPEKLQKQIRDDSWASLRAFRKCWAISPEFRHEAGVGAVFGELPFTAQPIRVDRWNGGHRAYYLTDGGDGTCRSVSVHRGVVEWTPGRAALAAHGRILETYLSPNRSKKPALPPGKEPQVSTKEAEFNPASLWPQAPFKPDYHPASAASFATIPQPFQHGSLRVEDGVWKILLAGGSGDQGYGWVDFNPKNPTHMYLANNANRYPRDPKTGASWAYGNHANLHTEFEAYFLEVYGRLPEPMELADLHFSRANWNELKRKYAEKTGFTPPPTEGPAKPPVTPPVDSPTDAERFAALRVELRDILSRQNPPRAGGLPAREWRKMISEVEDALNRAS